MARILIVEDDAILASHLEKILEQFGYQVAGMVATGNQAVKMALKERPDIVLMDVRLRGEMTGIQAADKIHDRIDIPIVYLTAYTDDFLLQQAKGTDAYAYLAKPVSDRELRASLEMALFKHTAEKHVRHLNQVLRAVREVDQLITRTHDPELFLTEACKILAHALNYPLVTVDKADEPGKRGPYAHAGGLAAFLAEVRNIPDKRGFTDDPCRRVMKTRKSVIIQDLAADHSFHSWRTVALKHKVAGLAAIPMLCQEYLYGVLCVYADYGGAFNEEEVSLLQELAGDLAFALKTHEEESARSEAEDALHRAKAYTDNLIETANVIVISLDAEGNIQVFNTAAEKITGYPKEDLEGKNWFDVLVPRERYPEVWDEFRLLLARNDTRSIFENPILTKGGEERFISWQNSVLIEKGKPVGTISFGIDITERKKTESALRESEERFRSLYENATIGLYRTTVDGRILIANPAAVRMLGYPSFEELSKRNLEGEGYGPSYSRKDFRNRIESQGEIKGLEAVWKKMDGSLITVRESARVIRDSQGNVLYYEGTVEDISERKRAEEQYRMLAENMTDTVWLMDMKLQTSYISPSVTKLSGYTLEELKTIPLDRQMSPESFSRALKTLSQIIGPTNPALDEPPVPITIELEFYKKDGTSYWSENTFSIIQGTTGQPYAILGSGRDITERKKAQEALQDSEKRFRALTENNIDIVSLVDPRGQVLYHSPAYERVLGFDPRQRAGQSIFEHIHPEDQKAVAQGFYELVRHPGETNSFSLRIRHKDGSWRWLEATATNLLGESAIQAIVINSHDITARKEAQEGMQKSERRFRALIENSADIVTLIGRDGNVLYDSPAYGRVLGRDPGGRIGRDALETVHPDELQEISQSLGELVQTPGLVRHATFRIHHEDGSWRWMDATGTNLLDDPAVQAIVINMHDITERKRAEESIRHQLAELEVLYENGLGLGRLLEPKEIARRMIEILVTKLAWHHAAIRLYHPESNRTELLALSRPGLTQKQTEDEIRRINQVINRPGKGLSGWVIKNGATVRSGRVHADPRYVETYPGILSGIYIPIRIGERTIGSIAVESEIEDAFSDQDERLLGTLASQAGVAFENARLYEEAIRASDRRAILHRAGQEITSAGLDLEAVYQAIHRAADELMIADVFTIALLGPDGREIEGVYLWESGRRYPNMHIPAGSGISGLVIQDRKTLLAKDRQKDTPVEPAYFGTKKGARSVLAVPLFSGVTIIGAISVQSYKRAQYDEDDESLLEMLASYAGTAIDNARLFEREREQRQLSETLRDVLEAGASLTSSLDFDSVLDSLLEALERVIPFDGANVMTVDESTGQARIARWRGYSKDYVANAEAIGCLAFQIDSTQNLRWMYENRQSLVIPDVNHYPGWVHSRELHAIHSWVGAPILVENKVVAFFSADKYEADFYSEKHSHLFAAFAGQASLALQNAQLFDQTRKRAEELGTLANVSAALRMASARKEILPVILEQVTNLFKVDGTVLAFPDPSTGEMVIELASGELAPLIGQAIPQGRGIAGVVLNSGKPYLCQDVSSDPNFYPLGNLAAIKAMAVVPLIAQGEGFGALGMGRATPIADNELGLLSAIADMAANAIRRAGLHEQAIRHADQLATVNEIGRVLGETLDMPVIYRRLTEAIYQLLPDICTVFISLYEEGKAQIVCASAHSNGAFIDPRDLPPIPLDRDGSGRQSRVIATGKPLIVNDLGTNDSSTPRVVVGNPDMQAQSGLYVPMVAQGKIIGVLQVQSYTCKRFGNPEQELLSLVANTSAVAIENARLLAETQKRLRNLSALHAIDTAIGASVDLRVTMSILLEQTISELKVDAAAVLLLNSSTHMLEYIASHGFRAHLVDGIHLPVGAGLAGQAVVRRQMQNVLNLRDAPASPGGQKFNLDIHEGEDFVSYYAVPLIAKGQVQGVLEVYHRSQLSPDDEWLTFLEMLSSQAAIAIDNAGLFDDLQRSNLEIVLAYDATIRGWSQALELRDKETEGHAQRVSDLTFKLAQRLGIPNTEMEHVRRGVLLHDIGKMGIPDAVLLKPGKLTEEEWAIMRQHPVYAYEMLSSISYLKPALDIPHYHHERWDGSGYPDGLKGEQIPFYARIFAVVDVYDALTSDRPYRPAWTVEKSLEHIHEQSGKHFDPRIVDTFLEMMRQK